MGLKIRKSNNSNNTEACRTCELRYRAPTSTICTIKTFLSLRSSSQASPPPSLSLSLTFVCFFSSYQYLHPFRRTSIHEVRRRPAKSDVSMDRHAGEPALKPYLRHHHDHHDLQPPTSVKASDALPLPLYLTNGLFFGLFFSVAYFLLHRWREKIRNSTPLHIITFPEIAGIVCLAASVIYLLGFFGIGVVQSFISRGSNDSWDVEEDNNVMIKKNGIGCTPAESLACTLAPVSRERVVAPTIQEPLILSGDDEEVIKGVVSGTIPSYSLESKLGDCKRAAAIRREALQRMTGRSMEGLPLEGFDYESILGQCCEMPVGFVQIPVGIAGPLLLNGTEYMVPMATTEGCLVASTNRGCKAIYASGGASSMLLKDAMTRAPVVRFGTAKRAAELKFFVEDPANFDTLSVAFNRFLIFSSFSYFF